jgi:hypothetical protein
MLNMSRRAKSRSLAAYREAIKRLGGVRGAEQPRGTRGWTVVIRLLAVAGGAVEPRTTSHPDVDFSLSSTPRMTNPVGAGFSVALALPSLLSAMECKAMSEFASPISGGI